MKHAKFSIVLLSVWLTVVSGTQADALKPGEQADAFLARGVAAEKRGDLVAADNCYALALRVIPGHRASLERSAESLLSRGVAAEQKKEWLGAEKLYTAALSVYAGHAGAKARLMELKKKKPILEEIAKTIIPKLELKEATPAEAFQGISAATGIRITYIPRRKSPPNSTAPQNPGQQRITISLNNLTAAEAIRRTTSLANLGFVYGKDRICIFSGETQEKLNELESQFKAAVGPAEAQAIQTALTNYKTAVQRTLETAARYADKAAIDALQQESLRLKDTASVPDVDPPGTPAALAALRAAYRSTAAAATRVPQIQPLYERYDASLASLAESLAGEPGEIAAVNTVRSRLTERRIATGGLSLATAVSSAQAQSVKKFPQLGQTGSQMNLKYSETHKRYQKEMPDFFKDPEWPMKLAEEVAGTNNARLLENDDARNDTNSLVRI